MFNHTKVVYSLHTSNLFPEYHECGRGVSWEFAYTWFEILKNWWKEKSMRISVDKIESKTISLEICAYLRPILQRQSVMRKVSLCVSWKQEKRDLFYLRSTWKIGQKNLGNLCVANNDHSYWGEAEEKNILTLRKYSKLSIIRFYNHIFFFLKNR